MEAAQFLCCTALLLWVKHEDLAEAHGKVMVSLSPCVYIPRIEPHPHC